MSSDAGVRPGFHRHANGGGWVEDGTSVHEKAFVGPDATIYNTFNPVLGERAVVRGGVVRGGVVRGGEVRGGEVWGGVVRGGEVRGGEVWGGEVWGGEVRGGVVRGGEVWGGVVTISPRVFIGLDSNVGWQVTITDERMTIGCKDFSHEEWLAMTPEQVGLLDNSATEFYNRWGQFLRDQIESHRAAVLAKKEGK